MPPTQWLKLRQNSKHLGRTSIFVRIDAPVVEKPDAISKKQSQNLPNLPENRNGSAPKMLSSTHAAATVKYASRA